MNRSLLINPSAFEAALQSAFAARSAPSQVQSQALERFAKLGLPHRRVEGWKWSDFNAALRNVEPANDTHADVTIEPSVFAALNPIEIQIVNGRVILPGENTPEGAVYGIIDSMAIIAELETHAIASLNVAMNRKAFGLEVAEGVTLERPVLIRHIVYSGAPVFTQTLLRVGRGAKLRVIETYEGEGAPLYSHVCHMALRDGAEFDRTVLHETGENAVVHGFCAAKIDGGAHYSQTTLSTGAKLVRHETLLHYVAQEATAQVNSAALVCDDRHCDITSHVLHKGESCKTRQLHKSVATDRARAIFQGKFEVERTAQQTDAKMTANALLLNEGTEANHKPELEIYADDVECAHGSTVGALDKNALFYLRQRGLSEHQARALLIEAFVGEVIEGIKDESVREILAARVAVWLEARS